MFESARQWSDTLSGWDSRRPETPHASELIRAYRAALQLAQRASAKGHLRNDKWQHCMLGAGIALATDLETTKYAGWSKERSDLADGKPDTTFDEVDYEATVDGADLAVVQQVCQDCGDLCEVRWGNRHERWDGTQPPP